MRPLALALAAALVSGALAGCAAPSEPLPDVMTTFYPLEFVAQRIVGPNLTVASVVKPGIEPHDYEATVRDVQAIAGAKALVVMGVGFESWLETAREQAPSTRLVVATEGLPVEGDPHAWLDPVLLQRMAENVYRGLREAFPDRAEEMQRNTEALRKDLETLANEFGQDLRTCEIRVIVTSHDAFSYLAARYGFRQIPIAGLDPQSEPDPRTVSRIIDEARAHNVTVIFFEELVSPQVAQAIAREVNATTRVLSPIESIAPERAAQGVDYLDVMRENLAALRDGMRCAA